MENKKPMDSVPEGFTLSMALVDALPVLFFSGSLLTVSSMFHSRLFLIGSIIVLLAGLLKVCWKLVIAVWKKNIRFLNRQMRYAMPLGFLLVLLSFLVDRKELDLSSFFIAAFHFPSLLFFLIGIAGIGCMVYFARHNDQADAEANWKEQCTNAIAQLAIMIGLMLVRSALL